MKPSSQTGGYTTGQCHTKTSTTAGAQTVTPDAFTLPGSLTTGQDTTFPGPGESYVMTASYTTTDPATRNTVTSDTTTAGGGLATGTLPWVHAVFDANMPGPNAPSSGTPTPPDDIRTLVDTASGKAWITLPYGTASMDPVDHSMAGWSASSGATQPDQGMADATHRDVRLPATPGISETRTTLHAVWHHLSTPVVTGMSRDPATNQVTITGTSTPGTARRPSSCASSPTRDRPSTTSPYPTGGPTPPTATRRTTTPPATPCPTTAPPPTTGPLPSPPTPCPKEDATASATRPPPATPGATPPAAANKAPPPSPSPAPTSTPSPDRRTKGQGPPRRRHSSHRPAPAGHRTTRQETTGNQARAMTAAQGSRPAPPAAGPPHPGRQPPTE
ncbi:hypothetical protein OZX57_07160 [Bifidobacterium sp. ESL0682]|uniref:hypothetical protein n=1 Tax=Bifidobacterium sp. ESL0682 TaxID=2983212 RepID=UPI0023F64C66|nr:hypothetical protein [Bifidobacterium sp. ESL0682]WEV41741.1 hypothetical protein OZX57_07160 [Bifidobacterium sp. ESL0682]